jgi:hypothetical protein
MPRVGVAYAAAQLEIVLGFRTVVAFVAFISGRAQRTVRRGRAANQLVELLPSDVTDAEKGEIPIRDIADRDAFVAHRRNVRA